jgi:3-phosphoshikimate 1-carboxyvinyltransferase
MEPLGVHSEMTGSLMKLTKINPGPALSCDFTHCPDLAQTVAVVCGAKGIQGEFRGLQSLRIKETDRIAALQKELGKIGAELREEKDHWKLVPSTNLPSKAFFNTYKDHRMAMAFAPLATMMDVEIENPGVTRKSYPRFWDDLRSVGIRG